VIVSDGISFIFRDVFAFILAYLTSAATFAIADRYSFVTVATFAWLRPSLSRANAGISTTILFERFNEIVDSVSIT
jgi:hypothetical protein